MKAILAISSVMLIIILLTTTSPARADLVYEWSMESETVDFCAPGSQSTPFYSPGVVTRRTTAASRSGDYSLDLSGDRYAAAFENTTNNDVWALTNEGAISLWWQYTGEFTGGRMLFMIGGGCPKSAPELDTNEGLKLFHRNGSKQLRMIYGWIDGTGYHTTWINYTHDEDWVEGHWYNVVAKWDTVEAPSLYLQVDGGTPSTGGVAIGSTTMQAYHQLLWGNDTGVSAGGLYLDDVQVWNDFEMVPEPTSAAILILGSLGLVRRRRD